MSSETLQTTSNILILVGFVLAAVGGYGAYHFSKKIEKEKDEKTASREAQLDSTINSLVGQLAPFEQLARRLYPNVDQASALQRLQDDFRALKTKTENLEKKTNIISSMELRITLEEVTPSSPVTGKRTSAGMQSAVAFFDVSNTRYRFVTDFQWSYEQVTPTLRRGYLIYEPEDPGKILGRPIKLLNTFKVFACDYSSFLTHFGFKQSNQTNTISLVLFLNGIEMDLINQLELKPGQLYAGQLEFPVVSLFSNFSDIYLKALEDRAQ